jgi:predicted Fe-Mo cluster-binding NifX family protein
MKIAVASIDGTSVCEHLARSSRFLIYEIEDGKVTGCSVRDRNAGTCGSHASFTDILAGCRAVLCGGVGQGAVDALAAAGTDTLVVSEPLTPEQAIARLIDGTLPTSDARVCLCGPTSH